MLSGSINRLILCAALAFLGAGGISGQGGLVELSGVFQTEKLESESICYTHNMLRCLRHNSNASA